MKGRPSSLVFVCLVAAPVAVWSQAPGSASELAPNSCAIACSDRDGAYPGLSASVTCGPGYSPVCQCGDPIRQMAYCQPSSKLATELVRVRQTIQALRTAGSAMYSWSLDQAASGACDGAVGGTGESPETRVDLAGVPVIDADALERLVVPGYLAELPPTDGWGRDLEFRLRPCPAPGAPTMSVRSAGSDGSYSGTAYTLAAFPTDETHQDVVWVDGYFGRWPEQR